MWLKGRSEKNLIIYMNGCFFLENQREPRYQTGLVTKSIVFEKRTSGLRTVSNARTLDLLDHVTHVRITAQPKTLGPTP